MKLKAKNYLGIKEADLDLSAALNIIMGENAQGKSSLRDAILIALGIQVRGVKMKDKKLLGNQDRWAVEFEVNSKTFKATATQSPTVADVSTALGVSKKALPFCLEPELIVDAKPDQLKEVLKEVLQLEYDWFAALQEHLEGECADEASELSTLTVKRALQEAEKQRAGCKETKGLEEPENVVLREKPKPIRAGDEGILEKLDKNLLSLEAELKSKTEKYGEVTINLTDEERADLETELKDLEKKIKSHKKAEDAYKDFAKNRKAFTDQVNEIEKEVLEMQGNLKEMMAKQDTFQKALGVKLCEDCRREILKVSSFDKGAAQQIQKKLAKREQALEELVEKGNKTTTVPDPGDKSEMVARVAEIKQELETADTPEDIQETLRESINELQERLRNGRHMRDEVLAFRTKMSEYNKIVQQNEEVQERWERWDRVAKTIQAIEKQAVGSGLDPLRQIIAAHKVLDNTIEIGEDLEITMDGRPYAMLSDTERYRLALVLYSAILELFEFPFCLIDRGDLLVTEDLRKAMTKDLMRISKQRPVIYIQAKRIEDLGDPRSSDKIHYFWVEEGGVSKL